MKKLQKRILISLVILFIAILIVSIVAINVRNDVTQIAKVEKNIPKQSTNATVGAESELSKFAYEINGSNVYLKHYTGTSTNLTVYSKYTKAGTQYNTVIDRDYASFVYGSSNLTNVIIQDDVIIRDTIINTFKGCTTLVTATIGNINTTSINGMFEGCTNLTSVDFSSCDTSKITDMENLFSGCENLTSVDFSNCDTRNVTTMRAMFSGCSGLTNINVSSFNTSNVTNMGSMFFRCNNLTSINVSNFDTRNVTNMANMFGECSGLTSLSLSNFNTSKVTSMGYMFSGCSGLTSLNLSNFDTRSLTDMWCMFEDCTGLTNLNISSFNTSNVTNMKSTFSGCSSLTSLDVSNFNTRSVTDMYEMFSGCRLLTSLDVSNFNTSNVTNMRDLFCGCISLTNLDLSRWNTSNVTNMQRMFVGCSALQELNLSNFDTSKVTDMWSMFNNCKEMTRLNLSGWDVSKVTKFDYFIGSCNNLEFIDLTGWDISNYNSNFYLNVSSKLTDIYTPSKGTILIRSWYYNESNINDDNGYNSSVNMSVFGNKSVHLVKCNSIIAYYTNGGTGIAEYQAKRPNIASTIRNNTFTGPNNKSFIGWNTSTNGTGTSYAPGDSYTTDDSLTLYAQWEKDEFRVTLETNEGTINSGNITSYEEGVGATLPQDITKTGYTFKGWYEQEDFSGDAVTTIPTTATGDKTYYAKWEASIYTVTLEVNEGTINAGDITNYTYGQGATLPTDVTKQGYVFRGWYKEEDFSGTQVTSIGIAETGDKTYYAKWLVDTDGDGKPDEEDDETLVNYTVEHYKQNLAQDGYDAPEQETKQGNLGSTVTAEAKAYTGFRVTQTNDTVASGTVAVDGSLTLKLYYNRESYNINYMLDKGAIVEGKEVESYIYGIGAILPKKAEITEGVVTLPAEVTKAGYAFGGWYAESDYSGEAVTQIGIEETGDKTYYAKWLVDTDGDGVPDDDDNETLVNYTIEHYKQNLAQNGYDTPEQETKQGNLGSTVRAIPNSYEGYKENEEIQERVVEGTVTVDGTLVLKLYYDRESYDITYVLDEGTINDTNYVKNYTYGIEETLPSNVTKQGYTFRGWYEDSSYTGDAKTSISATETGAKTYYASWTADGNTTYTVEYYKENLTQNGYDLAESEEIQGVTGTNVIAEIKEYTGFTENELASQRVVTGIVKADGSLTLKLYYNREIYDIRYELDEGEIEDTNYVTQYKYGIGATLPTNVIKEGYIFVGWYEDSGFTGDAKTSISTTETGAKTYYASWTTKKDVQYTVKHYKQIGVTNNYELADTEELTNEIGLTVTAVAKEYEGYVENTTTSQRVASGTIVADGSLELRLYYDTIKHSVVFKDGEEIVETQVVATGTSATAPKLEKEGYTLSWDKSFEEVTQDLEVNAIWTKFEEEIYTYKVEHYVQTQEGNELIEVEEFSGNVGQKVVATPKEYEAYIYEKENEGNIVNGTITKDKEIILKLFYNIKKVTVIIKDGDVIIDTQVIDYGTKPKLPELTKPGYILSWKEEDSQTGEIIYKAIWTKDPNYKDPNSSNSNNIDDGKPEAPSKLPQTGEETLTIGAIIGLLGMCVTYFTKYKF